MYYQVPFGKALWKAMICISRDPLTSVILRVYDKTWHCTCNIMWYKVIYVYTYYFYLGMVVHAFNPHNPHSGKAEAGRSLS